MPIVNTIAIKSYRLMILKLQSFLMLNLQLFLMILNFNYVQIEINLIVQV